MYKGMVAEHAFLIRILNNKKIVNIKMTVTPQTVFIMLPTHFDSLQNGFFDDPKGSLASNIYVGFESPEKVQCNPVKS
jgi:hypothetical protein